MPRKARNQDEEANLHLALRHPLRRTILREMAGKERISPKEVSVAINESVTHTSYHVRVLRDHDAIELVGQESVRGAIKHFYRMSIEEPWALAVLGLSGPDQR